MKGENVLLIRVDLFVAVATVLFLSKSEHFLVVLHQMIKLVTLYLIERTIEAVVVLNLLFEEALDEGFRLPCALGVGKTSPFHEIKLVDRVLAFNCLIYLFLGNVGTHSELLRRLPGLNEPGEVVWARVHDTWRNRVLVLIIEIILIDVVEHVRVHYSRRLGFVPSSACHVVATLLLQPWVHAHLRQRRSHHSVVGAQKLLSCLLVSTEVKEGELRVVLLTEHPHCCRVQACVLHAHHQRKLVHVRRVHPSHGLIVHPWN